MNCLVSGCLDHTSRNRRRHFAFILPEFRRAGTSGAVFAVALRGMDYYHVDSFTSTLFGGNAAGVCVLREFPSAHLMQQITGENKHSETAFVVQRADGDFDLRWFMPAAEVDLCGHATLAAAYALRLRGYMPDPIRFHTRSGVLTVAGNLDALEMDFPAYEPVRMDAESALVAALGIDPVECFSARGDWRLFRLPSEEAVRAAAPDFKTLATFPLYGYILTAPSSDPGFDIVSRFFCPRMGIDEDPVTGGIAGALMNYWGTRLGTNTLNIHQVSARGGEMTCKLVGDRVRIIGRARLYMRAQLEIDES